MATGFELTCRRVAFFRNMNLGRARSHSPTASELLDAFAQADAPVAEVFGTNGTVIFTASGGTENAREVVRLLRGVCGYSDAVMVRSARWVGGVGRRLRRLAVDHPDLTASGEVVIVDGRFDPDFPMPLTHSSGLEILWLERRHAITQWPGHSASAAQANRVVSDLMDAPATCRSVTTMLRLAERLTSG